MSKYLDRLVHAGVMGMIVTATAMSLYQLFGPLEVPTEVHGAVRSVVTSSVSATKPRRDYGAAMRELLR